jgi:hypothetical protein
MFRCRLPELAVAALLLLGALPAQAQTPAPRRVETVPARPIGQPSAPSVVAPGPGSTVAPSERGGRPKLAVLVLKTDDVPDELADNLTEVLIAALARRPESFDFVGKDEFKSRLALSGTEAQRCLDDVACMGRVGVTLGVSQIIAGTVGRKGDDYLYNLNLIDLGSGRLLARVYNLVGGGVPRLVVSLQTSAGKLFERARPPGSLRVAGAARGAQIYVDDEFIGVGPARRENLEPGKHQLRVVKTGRLGWQKDIDVKSGAQLDISLDEANLPRRRRWPKVLAWTSLGVAGGAGLAGLLLGILSQESAGANLGRQATIDYRQGKATQALTANVLFGVAGGAAITSALTFILCWKDIAGGDDEGAPRGGGSRASAPAGARISAGVQPTVGGALLQGGWQW